VADYSKLRVLYLVLEFGQWSDACKMPYNAMLGLEEGLRAQGIEPLTVASPWLGRVQEICAGQKFDQVWMEVVHQRTVNPSWLAWVAELAPVRLAILPESLHYSAEELEVMPGLLLRRHGVETRLRYMTHVMAVDEADAAMLDARDSLHAEWWPVSVPARMIAAEAGTAPGEPALFGGTPYGKRKLFLEHPSLRGLLASLIPPERDTTLPQSFDALQTAAATFVNGADQRYGLALAEYMHALRQIRVETFELWLQAMRQGSAVVNLPHMLKAYAGRVYEGIAAGRPMLTWDIPNRPRNRALWADGEEVLLFDGDSPEQLAEHLHRLACEPEFATRLANNALHKLRRLHTAEQRVQHMLDWTENGTPFPFD
jgi:glycosyl transferase family 1